MKYAIASTILVVAGFLGIGWVVQGNEFFMAKVFAPRQEAVRRETFEESKAYNEGMAQELAQMQLDYLGGNADQKAAIAATIRHRYAGYDTRRLPDNLRAFLLSIQVAQ